MTVEINTITRVLRPASQMSCKGRRHDYPRSIVTDHYLLDLMLIISPEILEEGTLGPANNCQFRMILKIILKKESKKRQASSSKQRLTMAQG